MVLSSKPRRQSDARGEDDDPLTRAIAPPPNETPAEKEARLKAEKEAQMRSDAIDEELNRQRTNEKKEKCVRVLLLGQSESGKSTTLKNFQLFHSPKAFRTERASWRAVVQLNVVRSIRLMLDAMTEAQASQAPRDPPILTPDLLKLKMRLSPVHQVEEALLRRLNPMGSNEFEATQLAPTRSGRIFGEIAVNSLTPWKNAFNKLLSTTRASFESAQDIDFDDPNDPGVILHACSEDMIRLWNDPTVRSLLNAQKLRLEDMAGFFLDSLERVTSPRYVPTDDDILKARLKTLGVSEHRFTFKAGNLMSHDWRVFDVGGARSLRAAWAPFFDNMDAIIFLAPISCFDQVLVEDPNVNRLEDSILLWKSVVSNKLLKNTEIVLFLNKLDIFKSKLAAGVQFGHYVVSYGDRPNEWEPASKYLMKKFAGIQRQSSTLPRTFYCHLTTVTDVKSTHHILNNVKDMVLRRSLVDGNLIFYCLNELTQVIYQSVHRFVVLSNVTDRWTIHIGLAGQQGRWWRGSWEESDILRLVGPKASSTVLETFAENLAKSFVEGELFIEGWGTVYGRDENMQFVLGPSSKKPIKVPLIEISTAEALAFATDVFVEIALQAQSRKCRLHPDPFAPSFALPLKQEKPVSSVGESANHEQSPHLHEKPDAISTKQSPQRERGATYAKDRTSEKRPASPQVPLATKGNDSKSSSGRPVKGVSLANPNKKARKYQALEFGSDDD